jgi:signal transduction histidine kinase
MATSQPADIADSPSEDAASARVDRSPFGSSAAPATEQALRRYAARLENLQRISLAVLSADSLVTIVQAAVGYIEEAISCHRVDLSLYDKAHDQVIVLRSTDGSLSPGTPIPITLRKTWEAIERGENQYIPDIRLHSQQSPAMQEVAERGGRSALAVPMHAEQRLLGVLTILSAEVRQFSLDEVTIVREVADLVALAIQNRMLLEAEQHARERERGLREVAASLTLGLDRDEVLRRMLAHLEHLIPFSSASIVLVAGWKLAYVAPRVAPHYLERLDWLMEHTPPNLAKVLNSCQPHIINDTATSDEWVLLPGFEYIRAWMGVPLMSKGTCIGALTIDRDKPQSFSTEDVELAVAFANQAAIAIENTRLFAETQTHAERLEARVRERTRELEALYGITAATLENPNLESVLRRALELSVQAFDCPVAAIHLAHDVGHDVAPEQAPELNHNATRDPKTGLRLAAVVERHESRLARRLGDPATAELLGRLASDDPPWIAGGAAGRPLPPDLFDTPARTVAIAPLRAHDRSLGVLSLWSETPDAFDDAALLLTAVADQIGAAVENIRLRQRTRQAAIIEERERLAHELHDAVTQTIYSAGLYAEAARESARAGDLSAVEHHTQSVVQRVYQALGEMRLLLFELRTEMLAQHGLAGALRDRLRSVEERANITTRLRVEGVGELPLALEETFYRVALEALNNALRHSHARAVNVTLRAAGGRLMLTVQDNGIGFRRREAARGGGMGLDSMDKRLQKVGGTLRIFSRPGRGTRIEAYAPLPANNGRAGRATRQEGRES